MLTVILGMCETKIVKNGVKPPKRLCLHQQNVNTSGLAARHILIGERRRLVDENVEKPVDVVVNEAGIDQSKRLIGRVYT